VPNSPARPPKKLVVFLPCRDEEEALPSALAALPRQVPGFDAVEWLLVDDGSVDRSVELARAAGVDRIVSLGRHRGLAAAFRAGTEEALRSGADVIVMFDADNQYCAADLPRLTEPILAGRAEMVVGERPFASMSAPRRAFQQLGSEVIRRLSGTGVRDAASGYRAFSREAALRVNAFSSHTASAETILQLGLQGVSIESVPVRVNPVTRPSRLIRWVPLYVLRQTLTILRSLALYRPFAFFAWPALASGVCGLGVGCRFLVLYSAGEGSGHVHSLILAAILLVVSAVLLVAAVLGSHVGALRVLLEESQLRLRRRDLGLDPPAAGDSILR
jgi:glycosyltransferase involved in cell wall biosynthesis